MLFEPPSRNGFEEKTSLETLNLVCADFVCWDGNWQRYGKTETFVELLWLDVISGWISLKCYSENKEVLNHKIILQTIIYVSPPCGQLFAILLRIRVELNTNFLLIIVNNKHFLQPINSKSSGHSVESTVTEFFLLLQKSW